MNQRRVEAECWDKTIISFESPHRLQDLCIEPDPVATREIAVEQQTFKIRLANSRDRRESASLLIQRMYAWRGYALTDPAEREPNRVTLVASTDEAVVATLTVGYDSAVGLLVDDLYKPEIDALRREGRRVCELTRLAVDPQVKSKQVLASLFHIAFIYGRRIHGGTDFVIEVNPRHAAFYKRMLGFAELGLEKLCPRVNAPALLLRVDLQWGQAQISQFGGLMEKATGTRSLYPYFFSAQDEVGITQRLKASSPAQDKAPAPDARIARYG
ncbi:MAG: long-chain N-acyl amino acid synthase [Betaproteobacteria bacterium]|nr:long-chain N-acyl amino acid synthase [Betaproteobacteria bacterium]